MEVRTTLLVGIDFGTSFSAVAYTLHNWTVDQRGGGFTPERCPISNVKIVRFDGAEQVKTQIAWHEEQQKYSWGLQVDKDIANEEIMECDRISMRKLGLENGPATEEIRKTQLKQMQRIPSRPGIQDLIRINLEKLFLFAKAKILDTLGQGRNLNIFQGDSVETVISVSAFSTPEMNSLLLEAARLAGIPNPALFSEAEAAAAMVIQEYNKIPLVVVDQENEQQENLTVNLNGSFLIADIGGGTGDFITYLVNRRGPLLRIKEGIRGNSELCGSTFLNLHFRDVFAKYIAPWFDSFVQECGRPYTKESREAFLDIAVADFEIEKRVFDGFSPLPEDKEMNIHIRGIRESEDVRRDTKRGRILIPRKCIVDVFSKILDPIVEIIESQIKSFDQKWSDPEDLIKNIFLVGGLSDSPHTLNVLREAFSTKDSPLMGYSNPVITSSESLATVVAKGAILSAIHSDLIGQTYVQLSIGIGWDEDFDEKHHDEKHKTIDVRDGNESVRDCINWLFRLDETVERGEIRTVRAWDCFSPEGPFTLTESLYGSQRAKENHLRIHDPINHIETIGKISVDLFDPEISEKVALNQFRRVAHPTTGQESLMMDYELRVSFDYPRLSYEIIIPARGEFPEIGEEWGHNPVRMSAIVNWVRHLK